MIENTFWHEPEGFHFWILGEEVAPPISESAFQHLREEKYLCLGSAVVIYVVSEFSSIPIRMIYSDISSETINDAKWDRIVQCEIQTSSGQIRLQSSVSDEFGGLKAFPGRFGIRIYFGGQSTRQPSGESSDFYLIQVWPIP